jgi:hypothetical protein
MTEGTVPVSPHRPCAYRDKDILSGEGIAFPGEHKAGEGEKTRSVYPGIELFSRFIPFL